MEKERRNGTKRYAKKMHNKINNKRIILNLFTYCSRHDGYINIDL